MKTWLSLILGTCCIAAISTNAAQADDTVTLRMGTHLATTSDGVMQGAQIFIDTAEKASGGTLKIQLYPSEQAGKAFQMYDLVKAGAVDIADTATSYLSIDKMPLLGVMELPGLAKSACSVSQEMDKLSQPGQPIFEHDLKNSGVRVLAYLPYPPYGPAAARSAVNSVADLKGMKMRVAGGLMEHTVAAIGGVSVKLGSPEVYQALQRGTIDTVMFSYLSVKNYDLASVAKFGTTGFSFGTPGDIFIVSDAKFNSLTAQQQDALIKAGQAASTHWCSYVDEHEAANIEDSKKAGMSIHTWTADEIATLKTMTSSVAGEWTDQIEKRGEPAKAVVEAFEAAMAN